MNETTCDICEKELVDYDPQYCCNGFDCGCAGQPNTPPVCSNECFDEYLKRVRS